MQGEMTWLAIGIGIAAAALFALVIVLALTPISDYEEEGDE